MPFWFYAFIAMCVGFVVLGLWMIVGTESYWRARHWLHVKNVRDAEPHELALGGYKVAGVTVIIAGMWLGVTVSQSMIDKSRKADLRELFGTEEVVVFEPKEGDGEIRAKLMLGQEYFEATQERRDALEGIGDAELIVSVQHLVEDVSVAETDGRVVVTTWRSCDAATKYLCDRYDFGPSARDALRALPISLAAPLGDRHVVDGATGEVLDPFAGT